MNNDFINNLRAGQNAAKIEQDNIKNYNELFNRYAKDYAKSRKMDESEAKQRVADLVKQAGISDGAFGEEASEGEIANYGYEFLQNLSPDYEMGFNDYLKRYGNDEQKKAYDKLEKEASMTADEKAERWSKETALEIGIPLGLAIATGGLSVPTGVAANGIAKAAGSSIPGNAIYGGKAFESAMQGLRLLKAGKYAQAAKVLGMAGGASALGGGLISGFRNAGLTKAENILDAMTDDYNKASNLSKEDLYSILDNYEDYIERGKNSKSEDEKSDEKTDDKSDEKTDDKSGSKSGSNDSDDETTGEDVVFNVKKGDTFGQLLLDAGIVTDNGLWGPNGDVEFYTKQLSDPYHMNLIYPGQAIRLKRRRNR